MRMKAETIRLQTIVQVDDAQVVELARAGDVQAFGELVHRYERRVGAVLARLLPDQRDVEEALQDTFLKAWRSLDRFRGDSALFTWLYRIAVNEALQRLRRRQDEVRELDEIADPTETVELPDLELRSFLAARINALPFEYRSALALRDLEGLSNKEVADALGISLAAAKSRVHRARMQLRGELEEWERGRPSRDRTAGR
jgi:RNA polymerase sigma-70 factor (ECF subfamily)